MSSEREQVEAFVNAGKLMQLATLTASTPVVCSVWYAHRFTPDMLWFISRHDRIHSANIRTRPEVAGTINPFPVEGLGQVARAVSFTGVARELPTTGIDEQVQAFLNRWPQARPHISVERLATGDTLSRLYEVTVTEWVLFDEETFSDQPRRVVPAQTA